MHNLLITNELSVVDGQICPPPSVMPADLGALLDVVAERMADGGVLMLCADWTGYLGSYAELPVPDNQLTVTATAGAWSARIQPGDVWIRWTRDKRTLWTGEYDAMKPEGRSTPLIAGTPLETAKRMDAWTGRTGWVWEGTPGMTGNSWLVHTWTAGKAPWWNPKLPASTWGPSEIPFLPDDWSRPVPDGHVRHGYDLNKAYLSAIGNLEVAADKLIHRVTPHEFDPKLGGMWRVELSPWLEADRLPDPAGYGPELEDGTRWLSTQTLVLLTQLTDAGRYGGFSVRESYTAPARRLFRPFAGLLRDIINEGGVLAVAARRVYKETHGMWQKPGLIQRPDWYAATLGMARANLWRAMDKAAGGQYGDGPVPVRIDTDCVYYAAPDGTSWADAAPATFKLDTSGQQLGSFKEHA